ncbi:MAG: MBOAT family protein, partial [Clostridia bacterium]|nr:MBOAT family protein [Clostridia bacterium]
MLFVSMEFLILFLPIVLCIYYFLPTNAQNGWLIIASLFFYAWGNLQFIPLILLSILFNYFLGLRMEEVRQKSSKILFLLLGIAVNLAVLLVFKYLRVLSRVMPEQGEWLASGTHTLRAPLGLSFLTLRAFGYLADVSRGTAAQNHPVSFALYLSFFPQMPAGPLTRYSSFREQLEDRHVTLRSFSRGIFRFIVGINKKMLLANTLGQLADRIFQMPARSAGTAWLGIISFALQIYFDFSGYTDMALGLGGMFGFRLPENFNYPYAGRTVSDVWNRWHLSLGSWVRDYVYIPMGGSKVNQLRHVLNLMVVWLLLGLWHGSGLTFIFWGLLNGLAVVFESQTGIRKDSDRWPAFLKVLYRILTLLFILVGWVFFRSESFTAGIGYIREMFGFSGNRAGTPELLF